ncbi:hypothetical protein U9Y26_25375, partial [Escherichia coli]
LNPAGLSYTYQYEKDRITITDSLNRREVLHTQGEAGLKRVVKTGFDGRTQRYHHDLTGKLIRSEDEGLVTHWYYDEADRLTHRTVKGETAEQWQYD